VTLLRRWARRERITEAHRTHAYQHAAIRLRRHDTVTLAVVGLNLGWLLPLAFLAASTPALGLPALLLAVAPLLGLAVWLRAGVKA
jgi:Fuc2NAc and GlcNAc transferase